MSYIVIAGFNLGVDRRRPIYSSPSGSLWEGVNCHLTRGGDIEKRKAFALHASLPAGTFGLAESGNALYVFGSGADPGMPSGVTYQRLQHPTSSAMTELLDTDLFNGQIYAIAKFADGSIHHFYNGTRIAFWESASPKGTSVVTHKNKVYTVGGSIVRFSASGSATDWAGTGAGFINLANQYSGSESLIGLAPYQQQIAVFGAKTSQLWTMASDPASNSVLQVFAETGARAARAIKSYGDIDVFFLARNGIRSIKARESINVAGVADVGTAIDTLVLDWNRAQAAGVVEKAVSVVEPSDGRFWLAVGTRVFVYSYFPASKIAGWTWYEPGFSVSDFAVANDRVYVRAGDSIFLYGGENDATYDASRVTVQMPFIDGKKPGTYKHVGGVDQAANGTWAVDLLMDPNDLTQKVHVGTLSGVSFTEENTPAVGHTTHIAPLFVSEAPGYASLSSVAIHLSGAEDE